MKNIFSILFLTGIINLYNLYSQECICKEYSFDGIFELDPLQKYIFNNGQLYILCSNPYYIFNKEIFHKDFIIESCTDSKVTLIGDDRVYNQIYFRNDTLTINETIELPIGKRKRLIRTTYRTIKYYFKDGVMINSYKIYPIRKYSDLEIKNTILQYNNAIAGRKTKFKNLYISLLVSALSGNINAKEQFLNFLSNFKDKMNDTDIIEYENLKSYMIEREKTLS